jgi:hypothetical protein
VATDCMRQPLRSKESPVAGPCPRCCRWVCVDADVWLTDGREWVCTASAVRLAPDTASSRHVLGRDDGQCHD